MAAALAAALLAIVLVGDRLTGVAGVVRQIWSALSAISALIAVTVAFDGEVAGPVLLAMAVVVAVAGRRDDVAQMGGDRVRDRRRCDLPRATRRRARWSTATEMSTPDAVSTLVSSMLLVACAVAIAWSWVGER